MLTLTREQFLGNKQIYIGPSNGKYELEHTHDFLELHYVVRGSILNKCNGQDILMKPGDYMIFDYNVAHCLKDRSDDFLGINCLFTPEHIDPSLKNCYSFKSILRNNLISCVVTDLPYFFHDDDNKVFNLLTSMTEELESKKRGYLEYVRSCLLQVIVLSMRESENAFDLSKTDPRLLEVITYISENYSKKFTLIDLGKKFGISPSNLSYLFKKYLNISYSNYIEEVRISAACKLLQSKNISIDEIAETVGYSDARTFRNSFKKLLYTTPKQYRQNL